MKQLKDNYQRVAEELKQIEKKDGLINVHNVHKYAEKQSSAIHEFLDWDDSSAGYKYRIHQIRELIRQVSVVYNGKKVNAFYNVRVKMIDNQEEQGYVSLQTVLSERDLHNQVIAQAIREMEYWTEKYKEAEELAPIIQNEDIQRVIKEQKKKVGSEK